MKWVWTKVQDANFKKVLKYEKVKWEIKLIQRKRLKANRATNVEKQNFPLLLPQKMSVPHC